MPFEVPIVDTSKDYLVEEAAALLPGRRGGSRSAASLRKMIKRDQVRVVRRAGVAMIPGAELKRLLDGVGR